MAPSHIAMLHIKPLLHMLQVIYKFMFFWLISEQKQHNQRSALSSTNKSQTGGALYDRQRAVKL